MYLPTNIQLHADIKKKQRETVRSIRVKLNALLCTVQQADRAIIVN